MQQEEWVAWRQDPVTKEVWEVLKNLHSQAKEQWANGEFQDHEVNLKAIGKVQMLEDIINITFEETQGD